MIFSEFEKRLRPLLFVILIFLVGILFYRQFLLFIVMGVAAGSIHFAGYRREIKLNFGHVFFLAVILARADSVTDGILFLLLAGLLPEVVAGHIEGKTFIAYPVMIAFVVASAFFRLADIMLLGIIITFLNYISIFFLSQLVGEPLGEQILETGLPMVMNVIYFLSAALPLVYLIKVFIPA